MISGCWIKRLPLGLQGLTALVSHAPRILWNATKYFHLLNLKCIKSLGYVVHMLHTSLCIHVRECTLYYHVSCIHTRNCDTTRIRLLFFSSRKMLCCLFHMCRCNYHVPGPHDNCGRSAWGSETVTGGVPKSDSLKFRIILTSVPFFFRFHFFSRGIFFSRWLVFILLTFALRFSLKLSFFEKLFVEKPPSKHRDCRSYDDASEQPSLLKLCVTFNIFDH